MIHSPTFHHLVRSQTGGLSALSAETLLEILTLLPYADLKHVALVSPFFRSLLAAHPALRRLTFREGPAVGQPNFAVTWSAASKFTKAKAKGKPPVVVHPHLAQTIQWIGLTHASDVNAADPKTDDDEPIVSLDRRLVLPPTRLSFLDGQDEFASSPATTLLCVVVRQHQSRWPVFGRFEVREPTGVRVRDVVRVLARDLVPRSREQRDDRHSGIWFGPGAVDDRLVVTRVRATGEDEPAIVLQMTAPRFVSHDAASELTKGAPDFWSASQCGRANFIMMDRTTQDRTQGPFDMSFCVCPDEE